MSFAKNLLEEAVENRKTWIADLYINTEQHKAEIESNERFVAQFEDEMQELLEQLELFDNVEEAVTLLDRAIHDS